MAEEKVKATSGSEDKAGAETTPPAPKPKKPKAAPVKKEEPVAEVPKTEPVKPTTAPTQPLKRIVRGGGAVM